MARALGGRWLVVARAMSKKPASLKRPAASPRGAAFGAAPPGAAVVNVRFLKPIVGDTRVFTIVQGRGGEWCGAYADAVQDGVVAKNGFIVTAFDQGVLHGSSRDKEANPPLPMIPWELVDDSVEGDVINYATASLNESGAVAAVFGAETDANEFLDLFSQDLAELGPNGLAQGKPNSQKIGLVRGQCLPHGKAATFLKGLKQVTDFARIVCKAFGKSDPWDPAFGGMPCMSFDAVLCAYRSSFEGMDPHVDASEFEPGRAI